MMRNYVKEKVLARGKKISIGIDVHKKSWQVTGISEGEELFHGRIRPLCRRARNYCYATG